MNDMIRFAMKNACELFERNGKVFNLAGFQQEVKRIMNLKNTPGDRTCEFMLIGRSDIEILKGGHHYKIIENEI